MHCSCPMNNAKVHYSCPINSAKGAGKKKKKNKTKQNAKTWTGRCNPNGTLVYVINCNWLFIM